MTESIYSLDEESSNELYEYAERIDFKGIVGTVKKQIDEAFSDVADKVLDYAASDFGSNITNIALRKAQNIVESLLRGENLDKFGLELSRMYSGEFSSYDSGKIRESIVRDFSDKIVSAEMHSLMEENKRLKDSLEYYRR